jgi:endonuclease/exonuclease/phosphatase family metal-dependent hydrolase
LSWNIERGQQFQAVAATLASAPADILLLQEVDLNAARSGSRHIPEELARRLGLHYVFGAEFLESGQGTSKSPAYHGQAVLTSLPVRSASIIRFTVQSDFWRPRWFVPDWPVFQRRVGGRLALSAELEAGSRRLVVYNVHLESRGPETLRLRQIQQVLAHADKFHRGASIAMAGDLNVSGPSSPVIAAILGAGFRTAVGGDITTARGAPLDWIFVRGDVGFAGGAVRREVRASDHYPLAVRIKLGQ